MPIIPKPSYGAPCNRCGVCCQRELCTVGMDHFRPGHGPYGPEWRGVCPALSFDAEGIASCGLLEKIAAQIGLGCLAADEYHNFM